jgi:ribose 5-phosphate isomerase A
MSLMCDSGPDAIRTAKRQAARAALTHVRDGMVLGLGSGSTADLFTEELALAIAENGWSLTLLATSAMTERKARECGLQLGDPATISRLDLAVDGADEISPDLHLIKGGGGCLLREKIIARAADAMIVIADHTKMVDWLGAFALPVEVDRFALAMTREALARVLADHHLTHANVVLRKTAKGEPFVTDGGNFILDVACVSIMDPVSLGAAFNDIPGVVEHGLFLTEATSAVIASPNGLEMLTR